MRYEEEKREKLDQLEKKLYSRRPSDIVGQERSELGQAEEENEEIRESWEGVKQGSFDEMAAKVSNMARNRNPFIRKIFIISFLFFVLAAGVAAFVFLGGINMVSSRNVDITVAGPLSVGSGQETSFDINVINNNNVVLNSVSLIVEYPEGTRSANDLATELSQERFVLEDMRSGENRRQNIKTVLFGEKGNIKQFKISLEYRVENSSALFYKEKIYEVSISSAPVVITPTYPKEVNSNQEISFNIEAASNSQERMNDFLVSVEYPFGFVFKESFPAPSFGNNVWQLANLGPGEKKTISIRGDIIGQDNEERVFKINAGTANQNDERMIAVSFMQLTESILVKKPFIGLNLFLEGKEGDYAARGGSEVTAEILTRNNLSSRLFNVTVEVFLKGAALNRQSIFVQDGGFFQSANDTILWDKRSVPEFAGMEPGLAKELAFRLSPLLYSNIQPGENPEIEMRVVVRGERAAESGSIEQVSSVTTKKIILATDTSISSKTVRSVGNIENSGPVPPKVNTPTTYTVVWSLNNSFNQVSNAEVRATLPPYVKWTGVKSPQSEIINFSEATKEVVWMAGTLLPNTGFGSPAKEVSFQLEFLPSLSQVGQSPAILGEATLSGIDKITGLRIESKAGAVTTSFSGDSTFRSGDDRVVE